MDVIVTKELLGEVKNFLDITWEDPDSEKKLSGIIRRGMLRINDICGTVYDYSPETQDAAAKELLLNYVMYARANALDEFMQNYASEFNRLQLIQEAERFGTA